MLLPVIATSAASQVIQLPQFQYTTVNTTVLVPDQGEVLLGGVNQGSDGRSGFGTPLLGNVPVLGQPFKERRHRTEAQREPAECEGIYPRLRGHGSGIAG